MNEISPKLKEAADALYADQVHFGKLYEAINNLKQVYSDAIARGAQMAQTESSITNDILSQTLNRAVPNLEDLVRTRAFCLGLKNAVTDLLEKSPNGPVRICYAGTGALGTFIVPLTTLFSSDQIEFVLLEKEPAAVQLLKYVISGLSLEDYIVSIEVVDATKYTLNDADQIDILISECISPGLVNEPQVPITFNLATQLNENVILIPEQINLDILLINDEKRHAYKTNKLAEGDSYYSKIGTAFTLNMDSVSAYKALFKTQDDEVEFPEVSLEVPKRANRDYDLIMIGTYINVYKDITIDYDQSGLTTLKTVLSFKDSMLRFKKLDTQYIASERSVLDCSVS